MIRSATLSLFLAVLCAVGCTLWIMQAIQIAKENQGD